MSAPRVDADGVAQSAAADFAPAFDREWSIEDLLPPAEREAIARALAAIVGAPVALVSRRGALICGNAAADAAGRIGVALDLEPIAWLQGPAAATGQLRGAAQLLRAVLQARLRYRMASDLHVESVQADYESLKAKHAAVQASEARYRVLAAELEQRVEAQVRIIDERQRQLYQAERLASVGQLAAGVAHEINNPIGFVRSNLSTAQKYVARFARLDALVKAGADGPLAGAWRDDDLSFVVEDFDDLLKDSVGGIDRVARIVTDLKGFSNVDRPEEAVVDLNRNLEDVSNMIAAKLPDGVRLVRDFGPLPPLLCLPGHLNQVLLNVLTNAMQAVGDSGTISVRSRGQAKDETADGTEGIRVDIIDDGCGIPADALPRVFDPFFTTRPVGQGTGLGLALARDIVLAHSGRIDIDSAPGAGTTVSLWLPT